MSSTYQPWSLASTCIICKSTLRTDDLVRADHWSFCKLRYYWITVRINNVKLVCSPVSRQLLPKKKKKKNSLRESSMFNQVTLVKGINLRDIRVLHQAIKVLDVEATVLSATFQFFIRRIYFCFCQMYSSHYTSYNKRCIGK